MTQIKLNPINPDSFINHIPNENKNGWLFLAFIGIAGFLIYHDYMINKNLEAERKLK